MAKNKKPPEPVTSKPAGTPATPAPVTPAATVVARTPTFAANYARHLAAVRALDAAAVKLCNIEPELALRNVRDALTAMSTVRATLSTALPTIAWEPVFALEELAEGFVFAAGQVASGGVTREQIDAVRAELQFLREPALLIGRGLALLKRVPLADVKVMEAGSGFTDIARDGIALAAFYRKHAGTIAGQHPFTEELLTQMELLGEWLLRNVRPEGARAVPDAEARAAQDVVNRFYTEIERRYGELRKGAHVVLGADWEAKVPPLHSRAATPRKPDDEPKPE